MALLVLALVMSLGGVVSSWLEDLPDYSSTDSYLVAEPTRIYDSKGNEIAAYYLQAQMCIRDRLRGQRHLALPSLPGQAPRRGGPLFLG